MGQRRGKNSASARAGGGVLGEALLDAAIRANECFVRNLAAPVQAARGSAQAMPRQEGTVAFRIFSFGLALRLSLMLIGAELDRYAEKNHLTLHYTDVDYHVFSDAALLLYQSGSPYGKFTYRYPPLLAVLLTPNHHWFPEFGKVLFCFMDATIVFLVFYIGKLRSHGYGNATATYSHPRYHYWAWAFALNPLSSGICSRGSADCIINLVVLTSLYLVFCNRIVCSGAALGLAVYLRFYPMIYLPAFAMYLLSRTPPVTSTAITTSRSELQQQQQQHLQTPLITKVRSNIWCAINFLFACTLSAATCTCLSYLAFGNKYLEEAVYYHIFRMDHRHNFSPHFYSTYLLKSSAFDTSMMSAVASLPATTPSASVLLLPWSLFPFFPQLLLIFTAAISTASKELEICLLVQTLVFVAFNKVCTAQYFTWYLCFLPIAMVRVNPMFFQVRAREVYLASIAWIVSFALWLWRAHSLEILGSNSFLSVWQLSLAFHIGQCAVAAVCIRAAVFSYDK